MKRFVAYAIAFGLIGSIILAVYLAISIKNNRVKETFENPKIGHVYILKYGEQYDSYQIKSITKDSIYFNIGKSFYNGFDYDAMRSDKNFFIERQWALSRQQLNKFLNAEYNEQGIFDITELE